MAEVKTQPVAATVVADVDEALQIPGAIEFRLEYKGAEGIAYVCPCGCRATGWLPIRNSMAPIERPSWVWNGKQEGCDLKPSVHHVGHWHGHLSDGIWRSC